MIAKLFKGELSLGATFWKYGVLALIILHYALRTFASLLSSYLKGKTIVQFFFHEFHFIYTPKLSLLWTLCYITTFTIMIYYSYKIIGAVWKSSANYVKSTLIVHLSRLGILLAVFMTWYPLIVR
jgi:hypothetical protein